MDAPGRDGEHLTARERWLAHPATGVIRLAHRGPRMRYAALALAALLPALALAQRQDERGSKDHPLFTRMPNFYIDNYQYEEFGQGKFTDGKGKVQRVEGHRWQFAYRLQPGSNDPGGLAVKRNFVNAAKKIGGRVTLDQGETAELVITRGRAETWVRVEGSGAFYRLYIVEKAGMEQSVVADADALARDLGASGHVAVGGILFDTGRSELKPESAAAVAQVAKLMQTNAGLKLAVVGHTDTVGDAAANLRLSADRAAAVIQALVADHAIARARLTPFGNGPYAPVASNASEEGRALNRRVEVVAQ
jgi:outer membrane protein OmpA-like peptidoglycan-associated protein